jgi:hypothetical protein
MKNITDQVNSIASLPCVHTPTHEVECVPLFFLLNFMFVS